MGKSDSEGELKKKKGKKDRDKDSGDERKEKKKEKVGKKKEEWKEKVDKEKEEGKEKLDKKKEEGKKKTDKDKEEKKDKKDKEKERWDKEKEESKEKVDREKEERKAHWDKAEGRKSKEKEEKDEKKKHKEDKDKHGHSHLEDEKHKLSHISSGPVDVHDGKAASYHNPSGAPLQPPHPSKSQEVPWFLREPDIKPISDQRPQTEPNQPMISPPIQYTPHPPPQLQPFQAVGSAREVPPAQGIPPSGYRIPLDPNSQLPAPDRLGPPPAIDSDGSTPVFIGSAIFPGSVHPCRIVPSLNPPCRVLFGGSEVEHHGRYDLLPVTQHMEWVPTKNGAIPPGRRPVEGGYESNGSKLYHALGFIRGVHAPGKAGEHLVSSFILFT